jgi:hypothetical protein
MAVAMKTFDDLSKRLSPPIPFGTQHYVPGKTTPVPNGHSTGVAD